MPKLTLLEKTTSTACLVKLDAAVMMDCTAKSAGEMTLVTRNDLRFAIHFMTTDVAVGCHPEQFLRTIIPNYFLGIMGSVQLCSAHIIIQLTFHSGNVRYNVVGVGAGDVFLIFSTFTRSDDPSLKIRIHDKCSRRW